jgi:two-component system, NarL family, response regulator NreC
MSAIRVLLVDDHAIVRAGVRMLVEVEPDLQVVGEAENGREAIERTAELRPDVVVMDISMPEMDGFEATRRIKEECPACSVLMLTMHDDEQYFFEGLRSGASGYVPKKAAPVALVNAIRAVLGDGVYLHPTVARSVVDDYLRRVRSGGERGAYDGLTDREREVLTRIAEGETSQAIAVALGISLKTVERHRTNIMEKLNLHNRIELTRYAIRKGLIQA